MVLWRKVSTALKASAWCDSRLRRREDDKESSQNGKRIEQNVVGVALRLDHQEMAKESGCMEGFGFAAVGYPAPAAAT